MNEKDRDQSGWGGRRPGSGRKPRYDEPMVQKSVRLPAPWIEAIVTEFGTFQHAIETLVEQHLEADQGDQ